MNRLVFIFAIFIGLDCFAVANNPPTVRDQVIDGVKVILDKAGEGQITQKVAELVQQIRTASITRDINKEELKISTTTPPINTLARVRAIEVLHQNLEKIEQGHGVLHSQLGQSLGDSVKEWLKQKSDSAKQNVVDTVLKTIIEDLKTFISQKEKDIDQLHQQFDKLMNDVKKIMSDETDRKTKISSVKEIAHQQQEIEYEQFGDKLVLDKARRVLCYLESTTVCERSYDDHDIIITNCSNLI